LEHHFCEKGYLQKVDYVEIMRDFGPSLLTDLRDQGYRQILYYDMKYFGLLVPLREICETNEASYIVPINDELLVEMAGGIDEFSIYVLS